MVQYAPFQAAVVIPWPWTLRVSPSICAPAVNSAQQMLSGSLKKFSCHLMSQLKTILECMLCATVLFMSYSLHSTQSAFLLGYMGIVCGWKIFFKMLVILIWSDNPYSAFLQIWVAWMDSFSGRLRLLMFSVPSENLSNRPHMPASIRRWTMAYWLTVRVRRAKLCWPCPGAHVHIAQVTKSS